MLHFLLLALAGSAMSVSGSDVTWDFTVNPDGTGKVVVANVLPPSPPEAVAEKGADEILRVEFLQGMLFRTDGVDAWADVSMAKNAEGRFLFKGTAYFKDVTKVGLGPSRDGHLTWAKDAKGDITLSATAFALAPVRPATEKTTPPTEDEIAKGVADLKQKFQDRREAGAANLGRVRLDLAFHLPGTVADVKGFTKPALSKAEGADDGSVHWTVVGKKLWEAYEKAMGDDAFLRKCVAEGKTPMAEVMAKEITSALSVRMTGEMKPQFDYEAEVKAAKEKRRAMLQALNLLGPPDKGKAVETDSAAKKQP